MAIVRSFMMFAAVFMLAVSGGAYAKQDKNTGPGQNRGAESSEINSNKQMKTAQDVQGADRAAERHELKDTKAPAKARKITRAKVKKYPRASQ